MSGHVDVDQLVPEPPGELAVPEVFVERGLHELEREHPEDSRPKKPRHLIAGSLMAFEIAVESG